MPRFPPVISAIRCVVAICAAFLPRCWSVASFHAPAPASPRTSSRRCAGPLLRQPPPRRQAHAGSAPIARQRPRQDARSPELAVETDIPLRRDSNLPRLLGSPQPVELEEAAGEGNAEADG